MLQATILKHSGLHSGDKLNRVILLLQDVVSQVKKDLLNRYRFCVTFRAHVVVWFVVLRILQRTPGMGHPRHSGPNPTQNFNAVATIPLFDGLTTNQLRNYMGQARRRGTFEERRQQAIDRAKAEKQERQRKAKEWWDSLTPEQQESELEKRRKRESSMAAFGMWILPLMAYGMPYTMHIPTMGNSRRRR